MSNDERSLTVTEARTVIVLAAGEGKRMHSALPKVLHPLLGRTLVGHVLHAAAPLRAARTLVVVGNGAEQVSAHVGQDAPGAQTVLQAEQRGTGHASGSRWRLRRTSPARSSCCCGDTPLLRPETLEGLLAPHAAAGAAATVLTAERGRPDRARPDRARRRRQRRRGSSSSATRPPEERAISEINAGRVRVPRRPAPGHARQADQRQRPGRGVPDRRRRAARRGRPARRGADPSRTEAEVLGCNDRAQLATLRRHAARPGQRRPDAQPASRSSTRPRPGST